jgi:hypothetical protein
VENRRELKNNYKERPVIGGIYSIRCGGSGRVWIRAAKNLQSQINRFHFAVSTGLCPEMEMRREWEEFGAQSFSVSVLEELEKGKTQTDREFYDDIDALLQMWLEKQESDLLPGGGQHGR